MKKILAGTLLMLVVIFLTTSFAAETAFKYVGVKKCTMCHKTEKSGNQYGLWLEDGHSKAYTVLATEEAKKVATAAGITGDPQQAKECLVCHVVAFDAPAEKKDVTLTLEEGVSCEACHGPGSEYKTMKAMKQIFAGEVKGADLGLVEPTEALCITCHNPKSPTYKEFKFEEAVKKIAHPVPAK
jgi:hypothetical protein